MTDIMQEIQPKIDEVSKKIWNYFMDPDRIGNTYGVAGLMGNLFWESVLNPTACSLSDTKKGEGEWTKERDELYYHILPAGGMFFKMKDFTYDENVTYGLAGWQWWARKQGLYNLTKKNGKALCDLDAQLIFLWDELQAPSMQKLITILRNTTSVREASEYVALRFIADDVKRIDLNSLEERWSYAKAYYKLFSGEEEKSLPINVEERKGNYIRIIGENVAYKASPLAVSRTLGRAKKGETHQYIITSRNGRWHCAYIDEKLVWLPAKKTELIMI